MRRMTPCLAFLAMPSCAVGEWLAPLTVSADRILSEQKVRHDNLLLLADSDLLALPVGKGNYQDLFAAVAGAYGGNPSAGTFSLRGMSQDGLFYQVGTASNPLITVMEDGASLSVATLRYLPPVLWDLESAEVLRGPQLLGPGPNGFGGALHLMTSKAGYSDDGKAQLLGSENETFRASFAQDFVLRPEELALRVAVLHHESEGEVNNLYNADDAFGATHRDRYQARLSWHPKKSRDAEYELSLVHDESGGNPFATVREVSGYELFDRKTALNLNPSYPARRDAAILRATLVLPDDLELESSTALQQLNVDPHVDLDETPVLQWVANGGIDELRLTQDLSVARADGVFQWRSGGYFEASSYDLCYSGIGITPIPAGSPYRSIAEEDVLVLALYGRGDWEFVSKLHLIGGLRLQHDQRDVQVSAILGSQPEVNSTADIANTVLLPQIGLEWQPDERQSVGIRMSRSYHAGGASFAPSLGTTSVYDPEYAWDLELYGRMAPLETLALSVGVFHYWTMDQQITFASPGGLNAIDSYVANAASSRRYGSELEARWQPCIPLAITSTLGWVHTEFDHLTLAGVDRSGQPFPNAPEWTASLGVSYKHASGFFASALFSWADATYSDPASPQVTKLETRRLLGGRLGYSWEHASVYLFGSNLLNADYALVKFDNSAKHLPLSGQVAPARSIGIGCEFTW